MRSVYLALGLAFAGLGLAGALLPVLPTTPFLILAAACFTRSSARLERWLIEHPRFGPTLEEWRERGAIPFKAKLMALAGTTSGFLAIWLIGDGDPAILAFTALLIAVGLAYVFSRPS
ncbi:MAG: DUF454 domain-containing protein [Hyphomicrobiales bacterium]|nr:MAG: DUF454 domain-containing protein [Hyphomicrobiales bacterium]